MRKPCPIFGCNHFINEDRILCSDHFKMMSRATQCDFFGMKSKVEKGEEPESSLIEIAKLAVKEAAEEAAARRANMRSAISNLKAILG